MACMTIKMVNNEDLADAMYVDYPVDIVKFKKGATPNKDDANELWKMYVDWNGFEDPEARHRRCPSQVVQGIRIGHRQAMLEGEL